MPKNEETAAFLCRRVRSTTCSTSVPVAVMRVVVYVVVYVVVVVVFPTQKRFLRRHVCF